MHLHLSCAKPDIIAFDGETDDASRLEDPASLFVDYSGSVVDGRVYPIVFLAICIFKQQIGKAVLYFSGAPELVELFQKQGSTLETFGLSLLHASCSLFLGTPHLRQSSSRSV